MAIKLAFSTVACPDWPSAQVVEKAAEMGYDGIELRTLGPGSSGLACDPALGDGTKLRRQFEDGGLTPVCLSTSVALHHTDATAAHRARSEVASCLELAAEIGCPHIRVFGNEVEPGRNRLSVIQHIAKQTLPLLDTAAALGVGIMFENAGSFNKAKEWWWLFNQVDHPMLGMCWNAANAAAAGERADVSVPVLNSRIRLAKVKDTRVGEGSGFVPLGEGTVGIESFVNRLLGIGYDGFITVEWDRLWLPSLGPADEFLPEALKRLRGWLDAAGEIGKKGYSDASPMNKELKKLLDGAQKARQPKQPTDEGAATTPAAGT